MGFGKMPFTHSLDNYINYKVLSRNSPLLLIYKILINILDQIQL